MTPGAFARAAIVDESAAGAALLKCLADHGLQAALFVDDAGAQERAAQVLKRAGMDGADIRVGLPDEAYDVVLATQPVTSPTRLRIALGAPFQDAVQMSFGAPVDQAGIVEVSTDGLATDTRQTVDAFLSQIGKMPIFASATPDFPGQRLVDAYQWAADVLLTYHTTPWSLDAAMEAAGWGIGPCLRQDAEGLDKAYARRRARGADPTCLQVQAVDRAVEEGRLGRQIGWGWYRYPGGGGPVEDPLVEDLLEEEAWLRKITRTELSAEEMVRRMRCAVMNAVLEVVVSGQTDAASAEMLARHLLQCPVGLIAEMQALGATGLRTELTDITGALRDPWSLHWRSEDWPF